MKINFLIFFSIFSSIILFGQNHKIDSLNEVFNNAKHDTTRCNIYLEMGEIFENKNPDTALYFYNLSLKLAETKKLKKQNATSLYYIAIVYDIQGFYEKAITYFEKSLKLLEELNNNTKIADIYNSIGIIYNKHGSYENAINYYLKSLKINQSIKNKRGIASNYINIGNTYSCQSNYTIAMENYLKSLEVSEKNKDFKEMYICYSSIGQVYYNKGNYDESLEYFLKSLKISEDLNNKQWLSNCYINIGLIYYRQDYYNSALEYYTKALTINEKLNDKIVISICYNNIGNVYYGIGLQFRSKGNEELEKLNFNNAKESYIKSLKISEESGDKNTMSKCYTNIGNILQEQGLYNSSLDYFLKSLKIKEEFGDKNGISLVLGNIASINIDIADSIAKTQTEKNKYYNEAINYGLKSLNIANEINALPRINECAKNLMNVYEKLNNFKKYVEFTEIFITTKDSMFSESKTKALAEMGTKYETEKKQLLIDKLDKEKELQLSENKKQKIIIVFVVCGLLLVVAIAIIILRSLRITRKQKNIIDDQNIYLNQKNEEITAQSEEILYKNEELNQRNEEISSQRDEIERQRDVVIDQKKLITDSINYASNIQGAILRPISYINQLLTDSFIVFRPKDVVGGDFYWYKQIDSKCIIVVADCTGHGVPGAFMTLIGNAGLNQIVALIGFDNPALILKELNIYVKNTLRQNIDNLKADDGMDAGICVVDMPNRKLTYSGAKISLFHFKNNDIQEYKGDKSSLGYRRSDDDFEFKNLEIKIDKNEAFYMTSDGFIDISYGDKKFPLGKKKFKTMLMENVEKPMKNQGEALAEFLTNSNKNEIEQRDDINVFGFRI